MDDQDQGQSMPVLPGISHWIVRDGAMVEVGLLEWATWIETEWAKVGAHEPNDIVVASTFIDDVRVSTVFLVLEALGLMGGPPPACPWETMIFGGPYDEHGWRYTSRLAAVAGHDQVVAALRAGEAP